MTVRSTRHILSSFDYFRRRLSSVSATNRVCPSPDGDGIYCMLVTATKESRRSSPQPDAKRSIAVEQGLVCPGHARVVKFDVRRLGKHLRYPNNALPRPVYHVNFVIELPFADIEACSLLTRVSTATVYNINQAHPLLRGASIV